MQHNSNRKSGKEHESLSKEMLHRLQKSWQQFADWLKPRPEDQVIVQVGKTILKIPVVLLMIALSPIILIILIFAFLAAF